MGPPNISGTNKATNFKFLTEMNGREYCRKNAKLGQKGSCDPFLEFWDPLISRGQLKLETSSLAQRWMAVSTNETRNSSGDEIANVNFLYDDIVHAVKIQ